MLLEFQSRFAASFRRRFWAGSTTTQITFLGRAVACEKLADVAVRSVAGPPRPLAFEIVRLRFTAFASFPSLLLLLPALSLCLALGSLFLQPWVNKDATRSLSSSLSGWAGFLAVFLLFAKPGALVR